MLEQIGLSIKLNQEDLCGVLSQVFCNLECRLMNLDQIEDLFQLPNTVLFQITVIDCEYPLRIELFFKDKKHTEKREQYIAQQLSRQLNCKTIVPYIHPEKPHNSYYSLVFENEKIFLADDFETKFAGDGQNEVVLLQELNMIIDDRFDGFGNYSIQEQNRKTI